MSMRKHLAFITLLLLCGLVHQPLAHAQTPVTQWDRSSAMAAVNSVDIDIAVSQIGDISSLHDGATTLLNLHTIETRSDWPLPAREAAIHQFTRSLAQYPRETVATEVMQYLRTYPTQVMVPHEDHGDASVPLFNIRGAAAGVENSWQRAESTIEAVKLLDKDPAALVATFTQATTHNQRAGTLDALRQAKTSDIEAVQNAALENPVEPATLAAILGVTTPITTDTFAIQQLLLHGQGPGLSSTLATLDKKLELSDTAALLTFAITEAPAGNATLAIAAWWPRLKHEADMRELMLATLADPNLGASAALALAQGPDIQTIKALQDTAAGESIAAIRAQMALDINRAQLVWEAQQ